MSELLLFSPAKVNLCWQVGGRTDEGWHEVRGVIAAVSWYDRLRIRRTQLAGIRLRVKKGKYAEGLGPLRDNLVLRAARSFESDWLRRPLSVEIDLEKRIPLQAGLGGGSSNAASVLVGLQRLYGDCEHKRGGYGCGVCACCSRERDSLTGIAAELGADVVFFLRARPSWVSDRGQMVRPLTNPLPCLWLLIVKLQLDISTAWAYQQLGRPQTSAWRWNKSHPMESPYQVAAQMKNDFTSLLLQHYPALQEGHTQLLATGALQAMISGSGSAVFGIFPDSQTCQIAWNKLARTHPQWTVHGCHTLPFHVHGSKHHTIA